MIELLLITTLIAQDTPVFRGGVNEIVVDLVVRDKKGHIVRGLDRKAITVLEDGVPQDITGFRELQGASSTLEPVGPAPAPTPAGTAPNRIQLERQPRIVSLVFERLNQDGRRFARQAALDFIERDVGPNIYYGVFHIDRRFTILQPYTNDRERLKRAIQTATGVAPTGVATESTALDRVLQANTGNEGASASASATAQAGGTIDGASMSSEQAARMAQNMAEFASMVSREDLGRISIFSLWAVIQELSKLPGRKTVLYFAEGITLPNGLVQQFQSMISAANRANVSVYSIDARGLMTSSDQGLANQALASAVRRSWQVRSTETTGAEEFRTFDTAMDSIWMNGQNVMASLAESTGGTLLANTNDFRPFLRRISEDFNTYYEVVYRPKRSDYDGRFRAITVKVDRPDVVVQARNGYFSLPPMPGQNVYPYEVGLLRLLGEPSLRRELDYRAAVVPYQNKNGRQQVSLVFDLPMSGVALTRDGDANRTHVSFVALIKDANAQVVEKLSRDLALNQPLDKSDNFHKGRMIVTRVANLAPGRYTLESAVADHEGNKAAAKRAIVVIPSRDGAGPWLSGITLIRRFDKPSENPEPDDPYQTPQMRVVPTLADTVRGGKGSLLSVFFVIYPDTASAEDPQLVLDLLKDGKPVVRTRPQLPAHSASAASIPYTANVPAETLTPGAYEVRATVLQGGRGSQKSIFVTIE